LEALGGSGMLRDVWDALGGCGRLWKALEALGDSGMLRDTLGALELLESLEFHRF